MNNTLTREIRIHASLAEVWQALTDPAIIKQYFFGTEASSDWQPGSPITFKGIWEGQEYVDKGHILEITPQKWLKYDYWSSFSPEPDAPENYANITYELSGTDNDVLLKITQDKLKSQEALEHSGSNWQMVLEKLKALLEGGKAA